MSGGTYDVAMPRVLRRLAPFIAAAVVLSPLLHNPRHDSYPLSTYPMFAPDRGALLTIDTVVRVDSAGVVHRLDPNTISGTDEIVTASVVAVKAIRRGDSDLLCREVADRIGDPTATIEVRSELVNTIDVVNHRGEPVSVTVWAECRFEG